MKLTPDSVCIGYTSDRRAVWQNGTEQPFICVHDAKTVQHLFPVTESEFERITKTYTLGSLTVVRTTAEIQVAEDAMLFVCLRCNRCAKIERKTTVCPACGHDHGDAAVTRNVTCADISHNDPGGCQNKQCWKHHP